MDGIKRKTVTTHSKIETFRQPVKKSTPYPKREELFISREETVAKFNSKKISGKKNTGQKIFWTLFLLSILFVIAYVVFFALRARTSINKMNSSSTGQSNIIRDMRSMISPIIPSGSAHILKGQTQGRVNILLLGVAGEKKPEGNLTDTVMIISLDTENKKVAMLSLPRDFYVQIPDANSEKSVSSFSETTSGNGFAKINSLYKIGIANGQGATLVKKAIERVTDIEMNYFVAVDFDAFEKFIDSIGGVNIVAERDIYDSKYPGPNYSYQTFSLSKGPHLLDGATALKYARQRHNDPEGDFGRAERQQQLMQATKNRLFSMQTLFNAIALNEILTTLADNIKTDLEFEDIDQLIKLSKVVDTQNISNVVIDAWKPESLLKVSHVTFGNDRAFILVPRVGNYSEIQELAQNIFDQSEIKKRRSMIETESANISIINQSGDSKLANKIEKLLNEKLNIKNVKIIPEESEEILSATTIQTNSTGSGKIFTLDELIKKLPATLEPPARNATQIDADGEKNEPEDEIVLRLGSDLIKTYKYEEASIEEFNKAQDSQDTIDFASQNQ